VPFAGKIQTIVQFSITELEGGSNGRFNRQCGFLLGSGLTLVLDYLQVDGRCWTAKTDPGELEIFQP
jgi:hypothetical protein